MARKAVTANKEQKKGGELFISLFGPGMTALHKAGLAGLWMTLKALETENDGEAALDGGTWERTPTSVTLKWSDDPKPFFDELFRRSFKLDKNGLIWFPALGEPLDNMHEQHAVVLQEAMLTTFLQHGQTRKADKSTDPKGALSITIDETPLVLKFRKVTSYAHQKPGFDARGVEALTGWMLPGGGVRHQGLGNDSFLEESPERSLALRFAPAGAIFFDLRVRGGGVKPRYALVLPEINDLAKYNAARGSFLKYGVQKLMASGTADAGLRVLAQLAASNLLEDVNSAFCRVISFGTVPWATQQKTRVNLMTVRAGSAESLRIFDFCRQCLDAKLIKRESGDPFWDVPQVPDLVARNLVEGRRWWEGFSRFVTDTDRGDHVFKYEKGGLAAMVENREAFPEGPEKIFIEACHEAWRRRMTKLGERAQKEGASFESLVSREFEKLRVDFSRCKNAATLREAVTDFWARGGGPLKPLQDGWRDVLTLMDEKNWRFGKDLALLALASYKPSSREEADAISDEKTQDQEG